MKKRLNEINLKQKIFYKNIKNLKKGSIVFEQSLLVFNDCFLKSAIKDFQKFIENSNDNIAIILDYVIGDKNKKNNVVTLIFLDLAHPLDLLDIKKIIQNNIKNDIKNFDKKDINNLHFLKKFNFISINIIFDKKWRIHPNVEAKIEVSYLKEKFQKQIENYEHWEQVETNPNKYKLEKKLIKNTIQNFNEKKKFNLIVEIEIITQIISLLIHHITKIKKDIRLFIASDRDSLLSSFKEQDFSLFFNQIHYYLIPIFNADNKEIKEIIYFKPEEKDKVWYDEIIRIADIIAGTIADWDLENNILTHKKFIQIIDKLLTRQNTIICRLETQKNSIFAKRIIFKKIKKIKISNLKKKLRKKARE